MREGRRSERDLLLEKLRPEVRQSEDLLKEDVVL
jgi:hypothetical protein